MYTNFLIFQIIVGFHFVSFTTSQEVGDVEVVHSWVTVDFTWESEEDREEAIANGTYIVENCIASGMKVMFYVKCINGKPAVYVSVISFNLLKIYNDEIYLTVPRFLAGVPSTPEQGGHR